MRALGLVAHAGGHEARNHAHKLTSYDACLPCQLQCMHIYMVGITTEGSLGRWDAWCPAIASGVSKYKSVNHLPGITMSNQVCKSISRVTSCFESSYS